MAKLFITLASLSGMLAVAFGAFGAHALRGRLDEHMMSVFQTAVQYHFYHSLALLAVGVIALSQPHTALLRSSGYLFLVGHRGVFRQPLPVEYGWPALAGCHYPAGRPRLYRRLGLPRRCQLENAGLTRLPPLAAPETRRPIRSFVLRTGRMTPGQQRAFDQNWARWGLEHDAGMLDFDGSFGRPGPCVLEIGFGMGQSLVAMAAAAPRDQFYRHRSSSSRRRQAAAQHGGAGRR